MATTTKASSKSKKGEYAKMENMEIKCSAEPPVSSSSSSNAEMQQSIHQLMNAVDVSQRTGDSSPQENKELKRRVHHEDVTTSNSEWEGITVRHDGAEHGVASMAQEWTDECETGPKVLGAAEAKALAWRAERILPECMETLVQHRIPVLYEIACGPSSVLAENLRSMTGRGDAAQRFAYWNGYDVSTTTGVRAVIS